MKTWKLWQRPRWFGRCLAMVLAIVALGAWPGCGGSDGPARYRYSGKVTFEGQPVPAGEVVFEPDNGAGNSGPQGFARIANGAYDTGRDKGTVGGAQIIRIRGHDAVVLDENKPITILFDNYEVRENLPKKDTVKDFQVTAPSKKPRAR